MRKTIFLIKSSAISYCPVCMEELSYRDSCKRILLQEGHERHVCIIRRMKCMKCGILHRELPDFLVPYKHYTAEVMGANLINYKLRNQQHSERGCASYPICFVNFQ